MRITLRQLEVFAAVCRQGGVTAAAEQVKLSQSSASQALAELEAALDGPLFDRVGRRLQINDRGVALRAQAFELLERAQDIEAQLRGRSDAPPPRQRLAASLTIGSYLLPQLLGGLLAREPRAQVELVIRNSEQVADEIANFRADAGFIEGISHHPELIAHRWREDQLLVVAAPTHPLARKSRLSVADLAAQSWVLRERGSGTREVFENATAAAGFTPRAALELGHTEAVVRAVAAGAGIGCLSKFAVHSALERKELVTLRCAFLELRRPLWLVLHRDKHVSAGLRAVLAACEALPEQLDRAAGIVTPQAVDTAETVGTRRRRNKHR